MLDWWRAVTKGPHFRCGESKGHQQHDALGTCPHCHGPRGPKAVGRHPQEVGPEKPGAGSVVLHWFQPHSVKKILLLNSKCSASYCFFFFFLFILLHRDCYPSEKLSFIFFFHLYWCSSESSFLKSVFAKFSLSSALLSIRKASFHSLLSFFHQRCCSLKSFCFPFFLLLSALLHIRKL